MERFKKERGKEREGEKEMVCERETEIKRRKRETGREGEREWGKER